MGGEKDLLLDTARKTALKSVLKTAPKRRKILKLLRIQKLPKLLKIPLQIPRILTQPAVSRACLERGRKDEADQTATTRRTTTAAVNADIADITAATSEKTAPERETR